MDREFDIIVYGASGFTARYVVKELMETNLKVALSGRSEERIKANIGFSSNSVSYPIIVSTSSNLPEITIRGRVVVNCAGPYIYCGEEVVKACISTKTHYVDITGEPLFVEKMIQKYHEEAIKQKVLVVPCCGYDSVPADIGVMFLKQVLDCKPVWARSYMEAENAYINLGTYNTLVHSLGNMSNLKDLRKTCREIEGTAKEPGEQNESEPVKRDRLRKIPFFSPMTQTYCTLFLGSDASVVRRSQKLLSLSGLGKPIQYSAYLSVGNIFALAMFICWASIFFLISRLKIGRNLLLKFPGFFSVGRVKKNGPTEEMIKNSKFKILFEGLGMKDKEERRVMVKVCGPDPGYIATPICATECAMLLVEMVNGKWKPSFEGGLLTPSSAFHGTNIIDRLKKKNINFEEINIPKEE